MILAVEKLSFSYGDRVALRALDLHINSREVLGLLGANGSGKSTLLRILATLAPGFEGHVEVLDLDMRKHATDIRRRIGVVFQQPSLDKKLTVEENLECAGNLYGLYGARLREAVRVMLERMRLGDRAHDIAATLSGGLRRRVEIARALLHSPAMLLLDEPSAGLDAVSRRELWQAIDSLTDVTVIISTHDAAEAARCGRLLLLHEGRRLAEGTPQELLARIGGDVVLLTASPELLEPLRARFNVVVSVAGDKLRIETPQGARFAAEAVEAFPGEVHAVEVHRPTLEDVLIALGGEALPA